MPRRPTIYVASGSKIAQEASDFMRACESIGYEVILDWTKDVLNVEENKWNRDISFDRRTELAKADLSAAIRADVFCLLIPPADKPSLGCWVEFGAAIQTSHPITIIVGDWTSSIFSALADYRFLLKEDAIRTLTTIRDQSIDSQLGGPVFRRSFDDNPTNHSR